MSSPISELVALEEWLTASRDEARDLLPLLLRLPGGILHRELQRRPEYRTAGVLEALAQAAAGALERDPIRAHELTAAAVACAARVEIPPLAARPVAVLRGHAWTAHASALRVLRVWDPARGAIDVARRIFEPITVSDWFLATVDLVEAALFHDLGESAAAVALARPAAALFLEMGDPHNYVHAIALQAAVLWETGEHTRAAAVWRTAAGSTEARRNAAWSALIAEQMGRFELQHGRAATAVDLLEAAWRMLEDAHLPAEALRTRWAPAEERRCSAAISQSRA
jgi:hypothetical protein